jgi:hypothetical protein
VAGMHGQPIRKPLSKNIQQIIQSRSIVYNRIDKAGSTTLNSFVTKWFIGILDIMAFKSSFPLIGQGTANVRYGVEKAKLASMLCDSSVDNISTPKTCTTQTWQRWDAISCTSTWLVTFRYPDIIITERSGRQAKIPISKPSKFAADYTIAHSHPV